MIIILGIPVVISSIVYFFFHKQIDNIFEEFYRIRLEEKKREMNLRNFTMLSLKKIVKSLTIKI
jgi:hypothetical protein